MANTLFDNSRQMFLEAQINWMTDTIKCLLVDAGNYTAQTATHKHLSDISSSAREVIVRNVTPELKLFGHNSQAFGELSIRTQWRNLYVKGDVMTKIGLHKIADSKQSIKVDGIGANKISILHHIKKLNTPPYATQYIELNKYIYDQQNLILIPQKDGYGIGLPTSQVPNPKLQINNILPRWEARTKFGQASVGQTWISNKIREISPNGFNGFVSEPDTANFKGRLKVVRVIDGIPKQRKPAQVVGAVGIDPNTIHTPNIKNKAHYIRPDGNSEQFRKGAW